MGNSSSSLNTFAITENPNRRIFIRYQSLSQQPGGLFGSYAEFNFKICYLRWHFQVAIRYNDLLKFEKQLIRHHPIEMSNVERLGKHSKMLVSHDSKFLEQRAKIMTKFLQDVVDIIPNCMESPIVYKFFQISVNSFQPEYGMQGKEGYLKKSSGGYIEKFSSRIGDYVRVWKWRWIVLHDNCITWYNNPNSNEIKGCIQIDQEFGVAQAGRVISLKTGTRRLTFFAQNARIANEWVAELQQLYTPRLTRIFFDASYPPRMQNDVRIYTNGCEYYQALALSLLQAQKEIMIASWKNSPTVLLTRPPLPPLRLDQILKYKADQGVQIFVLLYKEVEHIGQGNDSFNTKKKLEELSPNVHCIRHPNKFMGGSTAVLWSHHEKLVIVDRNVAFVGGIDLAFQRWDDDRHLIADEDGSLFPGNDYRQPAPGVFKPARNPQQEDEGDESDEEMIEVLVARPGENLPQAATALVDDDDQPFEVEVVVDFGMSPTSPDASPAVLATEQQQQQSIQRSASSRAPIATTESKQDDRHHNNEDTDDTDGDADESITHHPPGDDQNPEGMEEGDMTAEELEALRQTQGTETGSRGSTFYDSIQKSVVSTRSSLTSLTQTVISYASQAKAAVGSYAEQYITSQKVKKASHWETRDLYPRMGWHDVQAGLSGRAARDVASHFVQRWNHHRLSTSNHSYPLLRDITEDLNFTVCARCETKGIYETLSTCPQCQYDLGPVNAYSSPPSTVFLPSPVDRYSFLVFECRYPKEKKLPFRLHGDCPAIVTSMISAASAHSYEDGPSEGLILDVGGPMSEWLQAFGLFPAVGDVIATINGLAVTHLNSNQIKRLIKRIRKGTATTVPGALQEYYSISFRRHYLENLHPVDKLEETTTTAGGGVSEVAVDGSCCASLPVISSVSASEGKEEEVALEGSVPEKRLSPHPVDETSVAVAMEMEVNTINAVLEESSPVTSPSSLAARLTAASASAADYHPICKAAAQKEISFSMSRFFHEHQSQVNGLPRLCQDQGSCKVQVLRSVGKWSIGTKTECSILNCYLETIAQAHRFIYLENQFFISSLAQDGVQNKLAEALLERILRAFQQKETFHVMILVPLHPNGDFLNTSKSKVVMHYEYQTINRGKLSFLTQLRQRAPQMNIGDYLSFYSLRNWGVINHKIVTEQIYVHDKVMIVDDRVMIVGSANINDRSLLGFRDSEIALRIEDTFHIDSMLNQQPHTVGYLPFMTRVKLMRQHLGNPSDIDLTDPLHPKVLQHWKSVASNNASLYDQLDGPLSYYRCPSSLSYQTALDHCPHKSYLDPEARACVEEIRGFLIDWPQNFLSGEDLSPPLATRAIIPNEMWL